MVSLYQRTILFHRQEKSPWEHTPTSRASPAPRQALRSPGFGAASVPCEAYWPGGRAVSWSRGWDGPRGDVNLAALGQKGPPAGPVSDSRDQEKKSELSEGNSGTAARQLRAGMKAGSGEQRSQGRPCWAQTPASLCPSLV